MSWIADGRTDEQTLKDHGLRPTRQRLDLIRVIRQGGRRHLTPESFHRELTDSGLKFSLATIYNSLNSFTDAGLLRRIGFGDRTWYCTNPAPHHHFFDEGSGRIEDIPGDQPQVVGLPSPPDGMTVLGVEVIVRVRREAAE
ncbi:MAG: Fur family transcriptional regulator [Pseudomonadota bacterium]